jgi:hypothetical protein
VCDFSIERSRIKQTYSFDARERERIKGYFMLKHAKRGNG